MSATSEPRRAYAKMAAAQAALLADHQFAAEAEQAYRLALQISPVNPEAANGLAQLLNSSGRSDEARQIIGDLERLHLPANPPGGTVTITAGGK